MADRRQPDLLDWRPPAPVERFEDGAVRAATITGRLSRAVGASLREHTLTRPEIARRMAEYLGRPVSVNMLNAWASQERADQTIGADRLVALIHATGDRRLLEAIAELFGWTVIPKKFLPLIDLASVREREDELRRHADALRRQAKGSGLL